MYGHVPKILWEKWTPPDAFNRVQLACRSFLLQTNEGRNILFDVGIGDFFDPQLKKRYGIEHESQLLKTLATLGVQENEIDTIILSHLHFDHVGGLCSSSQGTLQLLFPKAHYYITKEHWHRAQNLHRREKASFIPAIISLLKASGRVILIDEESPPQLTPELSFTFSEGHTISLLISHIESPSGLLVYPSDLIPGLPWLHLPVTTGYDRYPELLVNEKEELLKLVADRKGRVLFSHDLTTACASIYQNEKGDYVGKKEDF